MLKRCLELTYKKQFLQKGFCTQTINEKWDLYGAVCLERKPIIVPPLNEFERKYNDMITKIQFERSIKSNHELQHEQEVRQQELLKKGTDVDAEVLLKETAQDFLDANNKELSEFKSADRITEADKQNNVKSLNRKLDKFLVLLTKQKLGTESHFLLPQGIRQDGETLRQTAERVLKESCGGDIKAQFYGNSPSGFYKYKYPKSIRDERNVVGAKVFIYVVKHCKGQISDKHSDYKWLDRKELKNELPPNYHKSLSQFLIDEEE